MPAMALRAYESVCQSYFKHAAQVQFLWFTQ